MRAGLISLPPHDQNGQLDKRHRAAAVAGRSWHEEISSRDRLGPTSCRSRDILAPGWARALPIRGPGPAAAQSARAQCASAHPPWRGLSPSPHAHCRSRAQHLSATGKASPAPTARTPPDSRERPVCTRDRCRSTAQRRCGLATAAWAVPRQTDRPPPCLEPRHLDLTPASISPNPAHADIPDNCPPHDRTNRDPIPQRSLSRRTPALYVPPRPLHNTARPPPQPLRPTRAMPLRISKPSPGLATPTPRKTNQRTLRIK
jgi:hypothetical protein